MTRWSLGKWELDVVARHLEGLGSATMETVLERRLARLPVDDLPPLGRDEDPADVLIDSHHAQLPKGLPGLADASVRLARRWVESRELPHGPEPLGELIYLCARIGAVGALPPVAEVIVRDHWRDIVLPGGEPLQGRALRCLSGLLAAVPEDRREPFRPVIVAAMDTPANVPAAMTALLALWPHEAAQLARARSELRQHGANLLKKDAGAG